MKCFAYILFNSYKENCDFDSAIMCGEGSTRRAPPPPTLAAMDENKSTKT